MQDIIRFIYADPSLKQIFHFLLLTLSFMGLEIVYGYLSGSLGLVSDGVHMLCDSMALLIGLAVSYISKVHKESDRYPFGLAKIEPLFGLLNGLFLVFVSINLFAKAYTKLSNPIIHDPSYTSESQLVAIGGLIINLIGLAHFHEEEHSNENIYGLFLHVLADTLGSIGVLVSCHLVQKGYLMADPICAMIVSLMIFISVMPLIQMSCKGLIIQNQKEV